MLLAARPRTDLRAAYGACLRPHHPAAAALQAARSFPWRRRTPATAAARRRWRPVCLSVSCSGDSGDSSFESSQPAAVDEAAVQRLVQRNYEIAKQHGCKQRLTPDAIAYRMRELLRAGLSEQEVAELLTARKGTPVSSAGEEQAARTLQLLRDTGLTPAQIAECLRRQDLLTGDPQQKAAALEWLRTNLRCSQEQLVRVVCRTPALMCCLEQALDERLCWWRVLARTSSQEAVLLNSLKKQSDVFTGSPGTLGAKVKALAGHLGVPEEDLHTPLISSPTALALDIDTTIKPRIDFLVEILANKAQGPLEGQKVRRRILHALPVLLLTEENLADTIDALAGVLGSRPAAHDVLRRGLLLFNIGSANLQHNWGALVRLLGGDEVAARSAVARYPGLLKFDISRDVFQQRLRFYREELGAGLQQVLNSYVEKSLLHVAPRLAWARLHQPTGKSMTPAKLRKPDAQCFQDHGVPVAGYQQFKKEWLASAEGQEWCRHEKGTAAKRLAAEGVAFGDQ